MTSDGRSIANYSKYVLLIGIGVWLIITGVQFAGFTETATSSTKAAHAATGAIIGAGVGYGTFLLMGGIGVVTGGVGFAIGAVALTALGVGAGALTGAATGKTIIVIYDYPIWLWVMFILLGCIALIAAYANLKSVVLSTTSFERLPTNITDSSAGSSGIQLKITIAMVVIFGVALGTYISTKTKRAPPPVPALENIVFKQQGVLKHTTERLRWNYRKTQIRSQWNGYYLLADDMSFKEANGKWVEQ